MIGDHTRISGKISILFASRLDCQPCLKIGKHVFVGHNSAFIMAKSITIGDHTLIGGGVRVLDNDGHPLDRELRRRGEKVRAEDIEPVVIGQNVWIGAQSTILKGVTIGDNAVVATGSVVTKDVPANTLVAGVPARVVRRLNQNGTTEGV
jgi:acetyltransferase-like isoleucine patch superfamily enzyme